jgi:hypothetical protein
MMMTPVPDSPTQPLPSHNWRTLTVGIGLFCVIGGLFLAAGFEDVVWPKMVAGGGIIIMVVGLVANAIMSRARPSGAD